MFCILLGHAMLICPFATTIQSLIIDQTVTFFLATLTHPMTNDEILSGLILPLLSNANTSTLLLHAIQIAQKLN